MVKTKSNPQNESKSQKTESKSKRPKYQEEEPPIEKQNFGDDYWETAKEKFAKRNRPLIPYKTINYELKEIKNKIGLELVQIIKKNNKEILDCENLKIGTKQISNLYQKINDNLLKQLKLYRLECKIINKSVENFINENSKLGSVQLFFDNQTHSLDNIHDFIEYFEVNMYASYHLMKKLDTETQQLNLQILENFFEQVTKDPESPYIFLARASRVGALIEGFRLKIQLIEMNKRLILESEIAGKEKLKENKSFDKNLAEFKSEFLLVEKRYKQHQNLWLRCSAKLNDLELYDELLYSEATRIKQEIVKNWKSVFQNSKSKLKIPKITEKEVVKGQEKKKEQASYNDYSAWLVIFHTMLYMLTYYGNAPTSSTYSKALKLPEALTGILQAATPAAGFLSGFHYSTIIAKSYRGGYIISFSCMIFSNALYYLAKTWDSIPLIVAGRLLLGYSGARVMTRNFVGTKIKLKYRPLWSSYLVAFTAISITVGPGISSVLAFIPETVIIGTQFKVYNEFVFFFFFVSIAYCIIFFLGFTDMPGSPSNNQKTKYRKKIVVKKKDKNEKKDDEMEALEVGSQFTKKELQSFHFSEIDFIEPQNQKAKKVSDKSFHGLKALKNTEIVKEYFPVYFTLVIFTLIKMMQESIITEIPLTVKNLYGYTAQEAGFLICAFTPLTLSLSLLPGYLAIKKNYKLSKMMYVFSILLFILFILKINFNYDQPQNKVYYIIVTCLALSLSLAAEVSLTSMFGKIAPYYIVQSFWNPGLLSGCGDTLGRALGNLGVTIFSSFNGIKSLCFYMYIGWCGILIILIFIITFKLGIFVIPWKVNVNLAKIGKIDFAKVKQEDEDEDEEIEREREDREEEEREERGEDGVMEVKGEEVEEDESGNIGDDGEEKL